MIHRNVALIACDTGATLSETIQKLGDLQIEAVAIGDRHLLLPGNQAKSVLDKLREHGQFPRLVGRLLDREGDVEVADVEGTA